MADADQTRARLLEAAGEEFAEKGFETARVRDICKRAGVPANPAAINYYFGSKEQLYLAAVREAHQCQMRERAEAAGDPSATPPARLRAFVRQFLENVLTRGGARWHHALMTREMMHPTAACEALVRESIRPRFERLCQTLREMRPRLDERRVNALAFSVIGQCLHYKTARAVSERLVGPEAFAALDPEYLTDHITRVTLSAIGWASPFGPDGRPVAPDEARDLTAEGGPGADANR